MQTAQIRSGRVTFAGLAAAVVAAYNILSGLAAITESDATEALNEVLYGIDIQAWGWAWLTIGVIQLFVALLIFARHPAGQVLGLIWAFVVAAMSVFTIFVAPLWALTVLVVDMVVIWALVSGGDEFEADQLR